MDGFDGAAAGAGDLGQCLVRLDFGERIGGIDRIARLDEPLDQLGLGETLTDDRQQELVGSGRYFAGHR